MKVLIISLAIVSILVIYIVYSFRRMKNMPEVEKSQKILDLTDKNFNNQIKNNITLVDFWAAWCVPCKMMAPVLNDLADNISNDVRICKVNVDEYGTLANKFSVRGIPTIIIFRDGKEVDRVVGVKPKEFLLGRINKLK